MSSPKVQPMQVPPPIALYAAMLGGELSNPAHPEKPPGKCIGCGSRHFVTHHERRICSYCRGEQ